MVTLKPLDKDIWNQISKTDKSKIIPLNSKVIYHTVYDGKTPVGIVGYIQSSKGDPNIRKGFTSTYILPKYRGKGYSAQAKDALAAKHKLNILYATILRSNKKARDSVLKAGYKRVKGRKHLVPKHKIRYEKVYEQVKKSYLQARYLNNL